MKRARRRPRSRPKSTYQRRTHPEDYVNPRPREKYDLIVIGGGPAGFEAALTAAREGFGVALIERARIGGNSLNAGSIPSKALIGVARIFKRLERDEATLNRGRIPESAGF